MSRGIFETLFAIFGIFVIGLTLLIVWLFGLDPSLLFMYIGFTFMVSFIVVSIIILISLIHTYHKVFTGDTK